MIMKPTALRQVCAVLPQNLSEKDLAWSEDQLETLFNIRKGGFSSARLLKIMNEFINGYRFIRHYQKAVSIFGSARVGFKGKVYQDAAKLGYELASAGFAVVTGGGPGVMEAANSGALRAGGESVGLNIQLPKEQRVNQFVNQSTSFEYFFTRKVMLASASQVYVFFPGGYGTLDELFEMMTLVQTEKITPVKIILVDKKFWQPMISWIEKAMCREGKAINAKDLKIFTLVDGATEAFELIKKLEKERKITRRSRDNLFLKEHLSASVKMPRKIRRKEIITPIQVKSSSIKPVNRKKQK